MSDALDARAALPRGTTNGGVAARRAVSRWAWRMFRREWRQQLLVLGLIVAAVAATIIGSAVATNTPPPTNAGFGTAHDRATFAASDPRLASEIAALRHRFGRVEVIANQTLTVPGSIDTFQLRAQSPTGPFGGPMLSLVSGHYPVGAGQVALSKPLASVLNLTTGDTWHAGGTAYAVVGLVDNPQTLLSQFALVPAGQLPGATQVTVLFDAPGVPASRIGNNVEAATTTKYTNPINPETLSLVGLLLGLLLIALVSVGGFTVLAQRRLRSLGMLASLGATDRNIALVVRTNGLVVGLVGAGAGAVLGIGGWLAYRPHLETSVHHVIGTWALPWPVVGLAIGLAVVATYLAAIYPARAITRVPVITALSGRPTTPREVRRSALPGLLCLGAAFILLGVAGSSVGSNGANTQALLLGLLALMPGVILLAPFCLSTLATSTRRAPITIRLALRDLSRYRARSGSALSAISLSVLISVIIVIVAAVRYSNSLDYAGPNLASDQLVVYTPVGPYYAPPGAPGSTFSPAKVAQMDHSAHAIASSLGSSTVVTLETTSANLSRNASGRNWNGPIYVGTPALLRAFGIHASQINPAAQVLTMRPGIATLSRMELSWGSCGEQVVQPGQGPTAQAAPPPAGACKGPNGSLNNPVIQEVTALPSGTSAPNTVITESAVRQLHLPVETSGWLIQLPQAPTAAQIDATRQAAANAGLSLETKSNQPTAREVINLATTFGIGLALAILAMTIGLIRSETAGDLRILTATGATSRTRRSLTAATAGGLALLGALLGTAAGYIAVIGFIRDNSLNGGISALSHVPIGNLLVILIGMPLAATVIGWLLAGREPVAIAYQPLE
jgi:putative ABC transport system permease protein